MGLEVDRAARLEDAAALLAERLSTIVEALFSRFLEVRVSKKWAGAVEELKAWFAEARS